MSLKKLKNRLKAEGVKFDVLCAMPEGTTLRVGKDLDGVLMWFPEDHVLPEGVIVFISPDDRYTYEALCRIVPNRRDWYCLVNGIDKKGICGRRSVCYRNGCGNRCRPNPRYAGLRGHHGHQILD